MRPGAQQTAMQLDWKAGGRNNASEADAIRTATRFILLVPLPWENHPPGQMVDEHPGGAEPELRHGVDRFAASLD
jgi:hypothetical protein